MPLQSLPDPRLGLLKVGIVLGRLAERVVRGRRRRELDAEAADHGRRVEEPEPRAGERSDTLQARDLSQCNGKRQQPVCERVGSLEGKARTSSRAFRSSSSRSGPMSRIRILAESLMSGTTLTKIMTAIKIDASGSKPVQPNRSISSVEMMTPTEPSVSARTCCKVPEHCQSSALRGKRRWARRAYQEYALHVVAVTAMTTFSAFLAYVILVVAPLLPMAVPMPMPMRMVMLLFMAVVAVRARVRMAVRRRRRGRRR